MRKCKCPTGRARARNRKGHYRVLRSSLVSFSSIIEALVHSSQINGATNCRSEYSVITSRRSNSCTQTKPCDARTSAQHVRHDGTQNCTSYRSRPARHHRCPVQHPIAVPCAVTFMASALLHCATQRKAPCRATDLLRCCGACALQNRGPEALNDSNSVNQYWSWSSAGEARVQGP